MAQNIHFQNIVMDRVEIKVGRFPSGILIVGRILNRRKVVNIHVGWHDQNPCRMLSSRPLDPSGAFSQAIDFRAADHLAGIAFISFDIAISRFIGDGADGPSPKGVIFPE